MKKLSVLLLVLFAFSFVNSHSLGGFLIEEPFKRGESGTAYVTIRNNFDKELENVNIRFYIYDLGLVYSSAPSDISKDDHVVQRLFINIPKNIPAGDYLTKITAGNDKFRDTQHVYIRIV